MMLGIGVCARGGMVGGIAGGFEPTGGRGMGCTGTPVGPNVACGLRASGYGGLTPGRGAGGGAVPSWGLLAEKRGGLGIGGRGMAAPGGPAGGLAGAGGLGPAGAAGAIRAPPVGVLTPDFPDFPGWKLP